MTDNRLTQMQSWLDSLGYQNYTLEVASEDASFRRYFRLLQGEESWIVMDAPPQKEACDAFVMVARKLTGIGLSAPQIIHENHDQGFLVITDFGDVPYLDILNDETAVSMYGDAIAAIVKACGRDRELWLCPTPEVRDSRTSRQIRQI